MADGAKREQEDDVLRELDRWGGRNGDTLALEAIVDRNGLAWVLQTLGQVCADKETHIRENWPDDRALADMWQHASKVCEDAYLTEVVLQL